LILTLLLFCLLLLEDPDELEVAEPDDDEPDDEPDEPVADEPDEPVASDAAAEESEVPSLDPLDFLLLSDEQVDFELSHFEDLEESSSSSSEFKVSSSLSSLSSSFLVLGFVLFLLD